MDVLRSDSNVHDSRILTGEAYIRVGLPDRPTLCIHVNTSRAEADGHIARIRKLEKNEKMMVIFARA